jgi:hypothetical protein
MRANEPFRMARQRSEVVIVSSFFFTGPRLPVLRAGCVGPDQSHRSEGGIVSAKRITPGFPYVKQCICC